MEFHSRAQLPLKRIETVNKKRKKSVSKRRKSSQGRKTVRHSKSRSKSGPKRNNWDMRTSPWYGEQMNEI